MARYRDKQSVYRSYYEAHPKKKALCGRPLAEDFIRFEFFGLFFFFSLSATIRKRSSHGSCKFVQIRANAKRVFRPFKDTQRNCCYTTVLILPNLKSKDSTKDDSMTHKKGQKSNFCLIITIEQTVVQSLLPIRPWHNVSWQVPIW